MVNELLYEDDLILMSETIRGTKERFWKDALESKDLKVNAKKTKVMVSRSKRKLFKSKIDPCGVYGRRAMANLMLCTKSENLVHSRCAKIRRVTARLATHFVCLRCMQENNGFDREVVL